METMKTNVWKELKCLEEANYQSLDEKRLVVDAFLANKIQEMYSAIEYLHRTQLIKTPESFTEKVKELEDRLDKLGEIVNITYIDDEQDQDECDCVEFKKTEKHNDYCYSRRDEQDQTLRDNEEVRDKGVKPNKQEQEK